MTFHTNTLGLSAVVIAALLVGGCGRSVFTGKREARGVWMSRFEYATDTIRV